MYSYCDKWEEIMYFLIIIFILVICLLLASFIKYRSKGITFAEEVQLINAIMLLLVIMLLVERSLA